MLLAGIAGAVATSSEAAGARVLGLVSPVDTAIPPEAALLYPIGMDFRAASVGLKTMTPDGYDLVLDRIAPVAEALARQGAEAIVLMGTSLSFYKGAAFNRELTQRMTKASGRPAVTMSTAVSEGLRSVGGKRLAVATAYGDEVNQRLLTYLHEEGFQVVKIQGLASKTSRTSVA
jgi:arylmalonate decarboxylase